MLLSDCRYEESHQVWEDDDHRLCVCGYLDLHHANNEQPADTLVDPRLNTSSLSKAERKAGPQFTFKAQTNLHQHE